MIVECTGCHTKYKIPDGRIPESGVEVRCPKCKVIFAVRREQGAETETLAEQLFGKEVVDRPLGEARVEAVKDEGAAAKSAVSEGTEGVREEEPETGDAPGEMDEGKASYSGWIERIRRAEETEDGKAMPEEPAAEAEPSVSDEVEEEAAEITGAEGDTGEEAAPDEIQEAEETVEPGLPPVNTEQDPRTLARALVSDILFYNRKKRDEGLAEDKILAYLGKEIARSWEIYKDRVGIEKAIETDHFREAVNDILADGRKIL
jgi:predicted Zn finger-like uncharacterized protein